MISRQSNLKGYAWVFFGACKTTCKEKYCTLELVLQNTIEKGELNLLPEKVEEYLWSKKGRCIIVCTNANNWLNNNALKQKKKCLWK